MSLISVDELRRHLDLPDTRVADVRWYLNRDGEGRQAYERGHIPGAIFLDLTSHLSAAEGPGRHPLPDPATFTRLLGSYASGFSR